MSDLAALVAQLPAGKEQPSSDPALAVVRLARASLDALVLKLGQSIEARVTAQLAGGLTQLTAGDESVVLKLETPLPAGTAVTIKVTPTPQGTPAITVSVPASAPAAQPLPLPAGAAPMEAQLPQPATTPAPPQQPLPQALQPPLFEPAAQPRPIPVPVPQLPTQPAQPLPQASQPQAAAAVPAALPDVPSPAAPQATAATAPAQPLPAAALAPAASPTPVPPAQWASQQPLPAAPAPQPVMAVAPTPALASAAPAAEPAPVLAAQPPRPLPMRAAPYPVTQPQPQAMPAARQLPLPAAAPRPAAPPLDLANPVQAAARQDTAAPLLARLAAVATAAAPSLPRPIVEVALKVLAGRIDLNRGAPDAKILETAVLNSGVLLAPPTREQPADSKSALLALRATLLAFLGGDTAEPVAAPHRPAPPIKGEPPRAPAPQATPSDTSADAHDAARSLLGHTEAALSRLKLLQSASQPAADTRIDAPVPRAEYRVEIPMLLGAETGILQLLVERDGRQKRQPGRERAWRMRFAMNFSATGEVGAEIALHGRAANIAIWAADPDTAEALDTMLPALAPLIQRHGLELTSLRVRRGAPRPARPAPGQLLDSAR